MNSLLVPQHFLSYEAFCVCLWTRCSCFISPTFNELIRNSFETNKNKVCQLHRVEYYYVAKNISKMNFATLFSHHPRSCSLCSNCSRSSSWVRLCLIISSKKKKHEKRNTFPLLFISREILYSFVVWFLSAFDKWNYFINHVLSVIHFSTGL